MPTANVEADQTVLAQFERRDQASGKVDRLRVMAGDFNGRQVTHLRIWYEDPNSKRPSPTGDGWYPTAKGVTIREHELDEVIDALNAVRKVVRGEGRSTETAPGARGEAARRDPLDRHREVRRPSAPPRPPAPVPADPDDDDLF